MGKLDGLRVAWCICGSFCNFNSTIEVIKKVKKDNDIVIYPVMTENAQNYDTRFGNAKDFKSMIEKICDMKVLKSLVDVEPLGPKEIVDLAIILPCTGNTMAKLTLGITDNTVLSAVKSLRRENKPIIIAISSNDMLGLNFKNLGQLVNIKNIFFVPMKMDNPENKPNSLVADFNLLEETVLFALDGKQIEPLLL